MNKMDNLLDKILARKAKEKLENRIHRCSYWGTYSRVLSLPDENARGSFIELDLTPINGFGGDDNDEYIKGIWRREISSIQIRAHGTMRDKRDEDMKELPPHVFAKMVLHLGEELVNRLLSEDFMSQIDLDKLHVYDDHGGVKEFKNIML